MQYKREIATAQKNSDDLRERGADATGRRWEDISKELYTPEELAASNIRVGLMIELSKARNERGISRKKLEALSGVKQPVIARMEKGNTSPQLDTVLKVLAPLGKTLYIGDLKQQADA